MVSNSIFVIIADVMQFGIRFLSASTDPLLSQHISVFMVNTSGLDDTRTLDDTQPPYPPFLHYLTSWYKSHRYSVNNSATNIVDALSVNVAVAMWDDSMICLQTASMPFQEFIDYKVTVCASGIQKYHTLKHTSTVLVDLDCKGKL